MNERRTECEATHKNPNTLLKLVDEAARMIRATAEGYVAERGEPVDMSGILGADGSTLGECDVCIIFAWGPVVALIQNRVQSIGAPSGRNN
jgi:hypothetical protein